MLTINAEIRKNYGKGASRRLRIANRCPAIIYGSGSVPVAIELDQNIILNIQTKDGFYTDVLTIVINNNQIKVRIKMVQHHPFKPKLTHIDFIRV